MLCCCFLASGFTYSWWISNKSRSIPWATGWLWPKSESRARKTLALIWTPWNARWKITRYEIHFVLISMTNFLTLQVFVSLSIPSLNLLKIRNLSARNIVWSEGRFGRTRRTIPRLRSLLTEFPFVGINLVGSHSFSRKTLRSSNCRWTHWRTWLL